MMITRPASRNTDNMYSMCIQQSYLKHLLRILNHVPEQSGKLLQSVWWDGFLTGNNSKNKINSKKLSCTMYVLYMYYTHCTCKIMYVNTWCDVWEGSTYTRLATTINSLFLSWEKESVQTQVQGCVHPSYSQGGRLSEQEVQGDVAGPPDVMGAREAWGVAGNGRWRRVRRGLEGGKRQRVLKWWRVLKNWSTNLQTGRWKMLAPFHRSDYLKQHLHTHSGNKPLQCDICGK